MMIVRGKKTIWGNFHFDVIFISITFLSHPLFFFFEFFFVHILNRKIFDTKSYEIFNGKFFLFMANGID